MVYGKRLAVAHARRNHECLPQLDARRAEPRRRCVRRVGTRAGSVNATPRAPRGDANRLNRHVQRHNQLADAAVDILEGHADAGRIRVGRTILAQPRSAEGEEEAIREVASCVQHTKPRAARRTVAAPWRVTAARVTHVPREWLRIGLGVRKVESFGGGQRRCSRLAHRHPHAASRHIDLRSCECRDVKLAVVDCVDIVRRHLDRHEVRQMTARAAQRGAVGLRAIVLDGDTAIR